MTIQRLSVRDVTMLENPGKRSEQLVWPQNAPQDFRPAYRQVHGPT